MKLTLETSPTTQSNSVQPQQGRVLYKRSLSEGDLRAFTATQPIVQNQPPPPPQPSEQSQLLPQEPHQSSTPEEKESNFAKCKKIAVRHAGCAIGTVGCGLAMTSGFMAAGGLSAGVKAIWAAAFGSDPLAWASAGLGVVGCGMEFYECQKNCEINCLQKDSNDENSAVQSHSNDPLTPPVNNVHMTMSPKISSAP